ncbi:hypothetical protein ACN6LL_004764, partial [Streptomyces violaceoruber]
VIHSDRGNEYTSAQFSHRMQELGYDRAADAPDHASTTPRRRVSGPCSRRRSAPGPGPTWATARADVFTFIETFYNRRRLRKHKIFGYLTPAETRQRHQHALAA